MGILTRQQDDVFVITSDRTIDSSPTTRAPARLTNVYEVWTGSGWSSSRADAINFGSLEEADEYVRANFAKVTATA
jgi:hypothetical protein